MGYPAPMTRLLTTVALAAAVAACGGAERTGNGGPGHGWPEELVTGPGTGPALYLGPEADSPAVGYVSPGVQVEIADAASGDRVPVRIRGALKVRAWLNVSRLAAFIQRGGRPRGAPVSVGVGDVVGVRGTTVSGLMRLELTPWLGRADAPTLGPFIGEYPADRLGPQSPGGDPERPSGTPHALPVGQEVPIYDRPNGGVIATLPALDPPLTVSLVREHRGWKAVRLGHGPYLIGYINVDLTPAQAPERPAHSPLFTNVSDGGVPLRLRTEESQTLWRVNSGARVRFDGRTIAIFDSPGYAREMNRYDTGEVDVFAAADDGIAVRGMIRAEDLSAVAGEAQSPAQTPGQAPAQGDPSATPTAPTEPTPEAPTPPTSSDVPPPPAPVPPPPAG
jgi:hypothetical protein